MIFLIDFEPLMPPTASAKNSDLSPSSISFRQSHSRHPQVPDGSGRPLPENARITFMLPRGQKMDLMFDQGKDIPIHSLSSAFSRKIQNPAGDENASLSFRDIQ